MNDVTKDLLEALRALVDSHWLEDSHAVDFDGTVLFSPSYDFSNLDCHRRSELRMDGFECVVWPGGYPDFKWSAYSTYEGSLWFEQFDSEAEARAVCMKLLADVMPEHSVSKAMAAIARAEGALAEPQPDAGLIGVQWWLAELDLYGNPALADGAHSDRAGADKAMHLFKALHLDAGRRFAVARVELSEPKPRGDGVNHEAIKTLNDARREAQP